MVQDQRVSKADSARLNLMPKDYLMGYVFLAKRPCLYQILALLFEEVTTAFCQEKTWPTGKERRKHMPQGRIQVVLGGGGVLELRRGVL